MQYAKPENKRKLSATTWTILAMAVLLLGSMAYIAYGEYEAYKLEKDQQIFTAGYNQGIIALYQQTDACQPVGIFVGEQQRQLIDVECLQQQ